MESAINIEALFEGLVPLAYAQATPSQRRIKILFEKYANFHYHLPDNKLNMMMDFYLLTSLPTWNLGPGEIVQKSTGEGKQKKEPIDPLKGGMPKGIGTGEAGYVKSYDANLLFTVKEVQNEVCSQLREELLHAIFFCMCCEIRHYLDVHQEPSETLETVRKISALTNKDLDPNLKKYKPEGYTVKNPSSYENFNAAVKTYLNETGMEKSAFVDFCYRAFLDGNWSASYGGPKWASIADGWTKLYNSHKLGDRIVWIDHVFDLQHNTNTVFNKLSEYKSPSGGYGWIAVALDHKKFAKSTYELFPFVSPVVKQFAAFVLKKADDTNYQDWAAKNPDKTGTGWAYDSKGNKIETKKLSKFTFGEEAPEGVDSPPPSGYAKAPRPPKPPPPPSHRSIIKGLAQKENGFKEAYKYAENQGLPTGLVDHEVKQIFLYRLMTNLNMYNELSNKHFKLPASITKDPEFKENVNMSIGHLLAIGAFKKANDYMRYLKLNSKDYDLKIKAGIRTQMNKGDIDLAMSWADYYGIPMDTPVMSAGLLRSYIGKGKVVTACKYAAKFGFDEGARALADKTLIKVMNQINPYFPAIENLFKTFELDKEKFRKLAEPIIKRYILAPASRPGAVWLIKFFGLQEDFKQQIKIFKLNMRDHK